MNTSIYDLMCKLPAIVQTSLNCEDKMPGVPSVKDITHNLQLSFYWWKTADQELREMQADEQSLPVDKASPPVINVPTLIGISDHLEFIRQEATRLAGLTEDYLGNTSLPPRVQYKVEQGYNKVMEALFSNEICKTYYEGYSRISRGKGFGDRDGG